MRRRALSTPETRLHEAGRRLAEVLAGNDPRGRNRAVPRAVQALGDDDGRAADRLPAADTVDRRPVMRASPRWNQLNGLVAARSRAANAGESCRRRMAASIAA